MAVSFTFILTATLLILDKKVMRVNVVIAFSYKKKNILIIWLGIYEHLEDVTRNIYHYRKLIV